MKITTLIENKQTINVLKSEHGLALHITTNSHNILFDTGQSNLFIENSHALKIDLKEVDIVVISHAHYDHIGGLIDFLNLNTKAKVYLKNETDQEITTIAKELNKLANVAHYYTGHCTSSSAFDTLSLTLGSNLQNLVIGHNIQV